MRAVILAAGRFGQEMKAEIAAGREPRLDVFELANALGADVIDFGDVDRSTRPAVKLAAKTAGLSAAVALLGFNERKRYDTYFTTGEDIGLPLGALLRLARVDRSHTMIAHTLYPRKKQAFFKLGGVESALDRVLVYATAEERLATETLGLPGRKVRRIAYHADERFFRPSGAPTDPSLICAAGQLLRDYDCLIEAMRGSPARVDIAAGSPWIDKSVAPRTDLPTNVSWQRRNRYALRELYEKAVFAVVPIRQNPYQTGIATILEMMAMGKCIIVSRTHGQTDTIVDGVTGVYVPPGDPRALRAAIERLLAHPEEVARIGAAARRYVEENAGLDLFTTRLVETIRAGYTERFSNGAE